MKRRIQRELKTVQLMIRMYCRDHHASRIALCDECRQLWEYAHQRVDRCPFQADKPTCVNCVVHCYKPARREQIRIVMRYAGPRMIWRHPVLAIFHLIDGRKPARDMRCR